MFQKHGKIRYCRNCFLLSSVPADGEECWNRRSESGEEKHPRASLALPSQLVSSGTSHLGSVKPLSSRCHRGVWVLNQSLGKPCFAPMKLSTGFIWSRGRTSVSAEVTVAICETLNEIFSELNEEEEPCHWVTAQWANFDSGEVLGFLSEMALHQWGCVWEYLKGSNKGYKNGVYIKGEVSVCVAALWNGHKWGQSLSVFVIFSRRLDKVTFLKTCYVFGCH